MHWFHVKHQVLYPANNHSAACVHIDRRDCIPKFALDEDFAGRRERRTDNRHFSDHPLLTGYNFISARFQSDRHKKYGDDAYRDSDSQGSPEIARSFVGLGHRSSRARPRPSARCLRRPRTRGFVAWLPAKNAKAAIIITTAMERKGSNCKV